MTPVEIQKIIDGECSHHERAALLTSIGDSAEDWRALALAALEEQQWSREISVQSLESRRTPTAQPLSDDDLSNAIGPGPTNIRPSFLENRFAGGRWWNVLSALAAGVLFIVGLYGGSLMKNLQTPTPDAIQNSLADDSDNFRPSLKGTFPEALSDPLVKHQPNVDAPMTMLVSGPNQSSSEIPLVDAKNINPELVLSNEAYETERLKQQFRRRGFEADVQPQFYSGRLKDGRQIVVPVHNVSIRPVGL